MGYTHYWRNNTSGVKFNAVQLAAFKTVLDYWQDRGIIAREFDEEDEPYMLTETVIQFNGRGGDGHETFRVDLEEGGVQFCKTARKPYDQAVCEILLLIRQEFGDSIKISSDGDIDGYDGGESWEAARRRLGIEGEDIPNRDLVSKTVTGETPDEKARGNVMYYAVCLANHYRIHGKADERHLKLLSGAVKDWENIWEE